MALTVTDLSRRINDKWVLRDVSFEAEPGRVFGIFGPSGSGKTELIKLLAGIDRSKAGAFLLDGRDISHTSYKDRRFQFPITPPRRFWQSLFNGSDLRPESGERRLKAIEKAITDADRVLLLDDPFCSMDTQMRSLCIGRLREIARERGLTVVFATNDYGQIFDACDSVGILIGGQIVQTGTPQEIYDAPANSATASIVGRNNVFYGRRITSSKSDLPEFQTIEGEHRLFTRKSGVGTLGAINKDAPLAIRPENVVISFGASFPEDNLIKAVVTGVSPRGATTRVFLDANGLHLEALVMRLVGLNIGDECMIALPPDRIQVLKH